MINTPVNDVADHSINSVTKEIIINNHDHIFFLEVANISNIALHKAGNIKEATPLTLDN